MLSGVLRRNLFSNVWAGIWLGVATVLRVPTGRARVNLSLDGRSDVSCQLSMRYRMSGCAGALEGQAR